MGVDYGTSSSLLAFLFFGFIAIVLLVIAAKTIRIVPQAGHAD